MLSSVFNCLSSCFAIQVSKDFANLMFDLDSFVWHMFFAYESLHLLAMPQNYEFVEVETICSDLLDSLFMFG